MKGLPAILLCLLCLLCLNVQAKDWPQQQISTPLSQPLALTEVLLWEDPSQQADGFQALKQLDQQGVIRQAGAGLGYSDSNWWLGFSLSNSSGQALDLLLDQPLISRADLWVFSQGRLIIQRNGGGDWPFELRESPFPGYLFSLPDEYADQPLNIVLRLHSNASIRTPIRLVPRDLREFLLLKHWLLYSAIVGALLITALLHFFKFLVLRQKPLGYFCVMIACLTGYQASLSGLTNLLLWRNAANAHLLELNFFGQLSLVFSCLFIAASLNLQQRAVVWLRNLLFAAMAGCLLLLWLEPNRHWSQWLLNYVFLATGFYQVGLTLLGLYLRRPFAGWFALFWSAAICLMILLPLSRSGVIGSHPLIDQLNSLLPVITAFMFGLINGKQLDQVHRDLVASQGQAIDHLKRYQTLFDQAAEGVFRSTRTGLLHEANASFLKLCGISAEESKGLHLERLFGLRGWQRIRDALAEHKESFSLELALHSQTGHQHWVLLSVREDDDALQCMVVDLSERRALEQRLKQLVERDPLTGLLNRYALEQLLSDSLNGRGESFSYLLYLDLNQFKPVNDLCGHQVGDQLLRQLAQQLTQNLQVRDRLLRLGGDEFVALLHSDNPATVIAQAECLRQTVENFVFGWEGQAYRLFVSIGMLKLDASVSDWQTALAWADNAAQQAKQLGRNRIHQFNPADGLLEAHQRELQWISKLRTAMEHNHFELFAQPVVPLSEPSNAHHYEVLLRYHNPNNGEWLAPGQFFAAAERYGLLVAIDRWVIAALVRWFAANPKHVQQLEQCNLNLNPYSLADSELRQLLDQALSSGQLPAAKLCLEITEIAALGELAGAAEWIGSLRGRGVKIALDDFGSGFASYAYLRQLPLDVLKIDGSFIRGIDQDPINQAMVGSMVQIAKQMGLHTVAECIENESELALVRQLGIDCGQGYHLGRPQPLLLLADHTHSANSEPSSTSLPAH